MREFNVLEGFGREEDVENFMVQAARYSCGQMFCLRENNPHNLKWECIDSFTRDLFKNKTNDEKIRRVEGIIENTLHNVLSSLLRGAITKRIVCSDAKFECEESNIVQSGFEENKDVGSGVKGKDVEWVSEENEDAESVSEEYEDGESVSEESEDVESECYYTESGSEEYESVESGSEEYEDVEYGSEENEDVESGFEENQDVESGSEEKKDAKSGSDEDFESGSEKNEDAKSGSEEDVESGFEENEDVESGCESEVENKIIPYSYWCQICMVYEPNGERKHMDHHIYQTASFMEGVIGYDEKSFMLSSTCPDHLRLSAILNMISGQTLTSFNYVVFERGLTMMKTNLTTDHKSWLNLLMLEILNFSSPVELFEISDIRYLALLGLESGFLQWKLRTADDGDTTLVSYVNAVSEFVKVLQFMSQSSFSALYKGTESSLTDLELQVAYFLTKCKKLSCILAIFIKGWKASLKPQNNLKDQATVILGLPLWEPNRQFILTNDMEAILTSLAKFMESFNGGNLPECVIQVILTFVRDMLDSLHPHEQFHIGHLNFLGNVFIPEGWLDSALDLPFVNCCSETSCLPIVGINIFLNFLELFNWHGGYALDLSTIYRSIYLRCYPQITFDIFEFQRI